MSFCASVHCMDGRIQEPIVQYLKEKYSITYVDAITELGPCKILAENKDKRTVDSILERIAISINVHGSKLIAISGHYDCAKNPCNEETQRKQIKEAMKYIRSIYSDIEIIGLWVGKEWKVIRLTVDG
ncbi:MAG: carbonic anhydrase [Candidatus Omnitrophota bacterium]